MARLLVGRIIFYHCSDFYFFGHLFIYFAMLNHDVITSNAVATLLSGAYHDVCYVQV
jgi:hypothetical protein